MNHDRRPCEIIQRRQIWSRINDLKSNCKELAERYDILEERLNDLTDTVDQLIAERGSQSYNPNLKIDFNSGGKAHVKFIHGRDEGDGKLFQRQLNPKSPSEAFKSKLSQLLGEMNSKSDEILNLTQRLKFAED